MGVVIFVWGGPKKNFRNFGGFFFGPLAKVGSQKIEAFSGVQKKKTRIFGVFFWTFSLIWGGFLWTTLYKRKLTDDMV